MGSEQRRHFLQGLGTGALGSFIGAGSILYLLSRSELVSFGGGVIGSPAGWFTWVYDNLGSSLPVFALLLIAWTTTLGRLNLALDREAPIERVLQLDHLADTWTTLFFGTGVIWTAIGMRSALIYALGDPDASFQQGAFAILERMVEGGILLALSTTIFGGIGGYLMRVYKAVSLGTRLQARYDREARRDASSMVDSLERIEKHLQSDVPARAEDN